MKITSRGFTLVELMIVIAIIGILAAALFPSLTAYLKRSRDAGRSANLNTIATVLGAYYSDYERYPTATSTGCVNGTAMDTTNYFPKGVPTDPLSNAAQSPCGLPSTGRAHYGYGGNGTGFVISAIMENSNGGNYKGSTVYVYTGVNIDHSSISTKIEKGTGTVFVLTN